MKNYKNMIKYGCNQAQIMEGTTTGSASDPNANTP